ncbi:redoxin family protein, partial [Paraburkholderia sp. SIMBA_054]|uniref:redoxin family protein n=1 Tax=Paraburkholderia sp. SIMBA_054 TaxID=3085795 RepID=UPI00397998E0
MTIKVGDKLPAATFKVETADGVKEMTTDEVFKGKKVVLFAVPGAFTPTCSLNHLPGYLDNRDAILAKGVDQ